MMQQRERSSGTMCDSTIAVLRRFAADIAVPVRRCTLIDPNFSDVLAFEVRASVDGRRYKVYADAKSLAIYTPTLLTAVNFSLNEPDRVGLPQVEFPGTPFKLYVDPAKRFSQHARAWLSSPENLELLHQLDCRPGEALHVYRNNILWKTDCDRYPGESLRRLNILASRLELCAIRRKPLSAKRLPVAFRGLMPLIAQFALEDDAEREELAESMSSADRQQLIDAVRPFLADIDIYLASLEEPFSEESIKLGSLAQFVAELSLSRR